MLAIEEPVMCESQTTNIHREVGIGGDGLQVVMIGYY